MVGLLSNLSLLQATNSKTSIKKESALYKTSFCIYFNYRVQIYKPKVCNKFMICEIEDKIFTVETADFEQLALEVFKFQYNNNAIYQQYVNALSIVGSNVRSVDQIPFLPIRFFKTADIKTTVFEPEAVFESSGTTQTVNSRHYVKDINIYRRSFLRAWEQFYGPVQDWCVIGLLPAYLERQNS